MTTGLVSHELYHWHNTQNWNLVFPPGLTVQPGEHVENHETKRRIRNLLEVSGLLDYLAPIRPRPATEDEIARFHTREHIAKIRAISEAGWGDASYLTPLGAGSFDIALLAAGGTIAAMDAVLTGQVQNAYALVRPPGHHAERNIGMGFCLFGNVPVAIMHAQATHGLGRVATVDWDVHHGNGTQDAFYDSGDVLTISLHQDRLYPTHSGLHSERGTGKGEGYNLNIPLPPGCGNGAYIEAFRRVVLPALERYRPDLIVVPSGFDACAVDPMGRMMVTSEGYRQMTAMLMEAADRLCGGRLMMSHEGGYSAMYAPYCGLAVLEEMSGIRTHVSDPWAEHAGWGQQELQPHQAAMIADAAALLDSIR
ncbi:class II histone deacetylase [Pseudomonas sp. GX19020]|uniref:class II histone deacetylase n=1 Tax=Pseudomonas sp. GX19020 TaxID=2942277 RepID=UPI002019E3D7|nr:class II histone deacetylase [Pseudomonas sp. GX19020]MCL4068409.1 class II histone deacetylase [Pseudomonas sp. GX19020]